jgi:outer membrane protein assembly factor BamB
MIGRGWLRTRFRALLALMAALAIAGCGDTSHGEASFQTGPSGVPDVLTYRGDNTRTARMPGPGPTGPPVEIWRHDAQSGYTVQPVVVGGRVIAVSDHGEVVALDALTGTETSTHDLRDGVVSNPAANGQTLFVVTQDGVMHALSIIDWADRWQEGGYDPETQIAVVGDVVLAGTSGGLVARSAADGTESWSVDIGGGVINIGVGPGHAYVTGRSDTVSEVDLARHAVTHELHTGGADVLTPAAVDDGVIVGYRGVAGGPNGIVAFDRDGNERWRFAEPHAYRLDAVVVGEGSLFVYAGYPGVVDIVDPATGIMRGEPHPLDDRAVSIPAVADGLLYFVAAEAGLFTVAPDGSTAWRVPYEGASGPARVVVTGGIVIVPSAGLSSEGRIVAFAAASDPRVANRPSRTPVATPSAPTAPVTRVVRVVHTDPNGFVVAPALAPDGTLYALDAVERVVVYDPDGSTRSWGSKGSGKGELDFSMVIQNDASLGIAVSPDGQLIAIGEGGNHRVQLFDPVGMSVRRIGRLGRDDGQFVNPSGVAVDSEHRIWVVDSGRNDVQVFDRKGGRLFGFGGEGSGPGQLRRPGPPFVREDADEVLIPDFANRRIAVFSKDGTFLRDYTSDPQSGLFLQEVNQVIVDASGRLFVLDTSGNVSVLDPGGHLVTTIPLTFDGLATLDAFGMALSQDGRLYVADPDQHVIVELQLEPPLWP